MNCPYCRRPRAAANLHFSPPDGRSMRQGRHNFVVLACRAQNVPSSTPRHTKRQGAKRLASRSDGLFTHFASPRGEKCRLALLTSRVQSFEQFEAGSARACLLTVGGKLKEKFDIGLPHLEAVRNFLAIDARGGEFAHAGFRGRLFR